MAWHELLILYHSFNKFLGSYQGEFFKHSIEFFILLIITYMVFSEYIREKETPLKYLTIAFMALLIEKFLAIILLINVVFGVLASRILYGQTLIIISTIEIISLLLIAHAFTYKATKKKGVFMQKIRSEITAILIIFIIFLILWNTNTYFFDAKMNLSWIFVFLELIKISVLGYAIYLVLFKMDPHEKYRLSVLLAFALYFMAPVLLILHLIFIKTAVIRVLAHPFPIIAVLLFMRAIYLKLVDKATLKEEITSTRLKYQQEREISKMKDEFVSTISHELKTPLTSIRLYLSILLQEKQGPLTPEQKKTLDILMKENKRLADLINDILDLAKLENKKIKLKPARTNLHALIDTTLPNNLAEEKAIIVQNDIPDKFSVIIDEDRFKQVIINLYGNAVKFTREGGRIRFSAKAHTSSWEFCIEDNGIGIPKDKQKLLFSKFYQVENYLTRQQGGTGLGLAIVKHIINLHGGTIRVKSMLDKGTIFKISLPNRLPKDNI
ncbi:MAG: HAMP domain-containing sensor histidine kinase [Nanoarchaeota archaeon]